MVTVSDAATHGFAVHESRWDIADVVAVGRHSERWRYKRGPLMAPRARAVAAARSHGDADINALFKAVCHEEFILNENFPEVPAPLIQKNKWLLRHLSSLNS